jgi:hypothetical protein
MSLKVLPLEPYMLSKRFNLEEHYPEIQPRFNRPGVYLDGDRCWLENNFGKAYQLESNDFKFRLRLLQAKELNERHFEALKAIAEVGLATKQQLKLLYELRMVKECRRVYLSARRFFTVL